MRQGEDATFDYLCRIAPQEGWTAEDAVADGKKFGLQLENQIDFLHRFHADLQDGRIAGYPVKS